MFYVMSNLFNANGIIDLDGDEETVNESARGFYTAAEAGWWAEELTTQYPNAIVDIT